MRNCPNGGRPIPPRGTLFRDPDTFGVPSGFTGSVRIDTHENGNGVKPEEQVLTATADYWNSLFNLFSSYRALDQNDMSTTILLPLVDREVGPRAPDGLDGSTDQILATGAPVLGPPGPPTDPSRRG